MTPYRIERRVIDVARLQRFNEASVRLRPASGPGLLDANEGSLMNWVSFLAGGDGAEETHPSVDPVIAAFCLQLSEAPPLASFRNDLKAFATRIIDTAGSASRSRRRAALCADLAVRTITPLVLKRTSPDLAGSVRAAPIITSAETAREGSLLARAAQESLVSPGPDGMRSHEHLIARAAADAADALVFSFEMAEQGDDSELAAFDSAPQVGDYAATCAAYAASSGCARDAWDASLARLERLINAS